MTRSAILLLLPGLIPGLLPAQVSEVGITGGVTYYVGDLNPLAHFPKNTKPAIGALWRYNINSRYCFRLQALYSNLEAWDEDSDDPLQQVRNLHFRTRLFEAAGLFEINFFKYRGTDKDSKRWTPFVFGGLAYFHTNPQARLDDTWYDLQPLGTEGQGTVKEGTDPYKLDQVAIPVGAGLKVNAGRVDFQLEWGFRRTYTDYIDDVSGRYVDNVQLAFEASPLTAALADRTEYGETSFNADRARGDQETRDWYYYCGLSITFIISKFTDCEQQYNWTRRRN